EASNADAFMLLQDGQIVAELVRDPDRGPIETMSATKSVLALVIGLLLEDGKITSLDQPVGDFFETWAVGPHADVTLWHLMTHTSGIADVADTQAIYASDDFLQFALDSEQRQPPGQAFFYSNNGTNLLAGLAEEAAGEPLVEYAKRRLFEPLGITEWHWATGPAGNPQGMAGLALTADGMARIGLLGANGCRWTDAPLLSPEYCAQMTSPSCVEGYGLLWWLDPSFVTRTLTSDHLAAWRDAGVDAAVITALEPLANTP